MKKSQLKRENRNGEVSARIISDGCRDYAVQIEHGSSKSLLCNRFNKPLLFKSLGEVHALLNRFKIENRRLAVRIAADEACQPYSTLAAFSDIPLSSAAKQGHR